MDFRGSLDSKTLKALQTYATTERPKGENRILLKVVDDGQGHLHLEAVDEKDMGFFEKWIGLLFRSEYKLQKLAEFFESKYFSLPNYTDCTTIAKALQKLDGKIKAHNESLFSRTVQLKHEGLTTLFEVKLLEKQIDVINGQIEIENQELQENLEKQIQEIKPRIENKDIPAALKRQFHLLEKRCDTKRVELQNKVEAQPKTPRNSSVETITPIPGDRNCLLRAVSCGLYLAKQFSEELGNPHEASAKLRHFATEYLSKNYEKDDTLKSLLTSAIAEYNETKKKRCEEEKLNLQAVLDLDEGEQITEEYFEALEKDHKEEIIAEGDFTKYIELSRKDDFDASAPHLYALSRHFQVNFELFQIIEKGRITTWKKIPFIPPLEEPKATIQLQNGVHFSVIRPKGVTLKLPEPPSIMPEEIVPPPPPAPEPRNLLADKFGYKLINRYNACYVNSVTQALRHSPQFREHLKRSTSSLAKVMKEAYQSIEKKHARFELDSKDFRGIAMELGFRAKSTKSQEDAEEFCRFLLNEMKMPTFKCQIEKAHTLPFTPPNLRSKPITNASPTDVLIPLVLGDNPANTPLQTLVNNNFIVEQADLLGSLITMMRGDLILTEEQHAYIEAKLEEKAGKELKEKILSEIKKAVTLIAEHPENAVEIGRSEGKRIYSDMLSKEEALKTILEVDTHQKLALDPENLPDFFPLSLGRFTKEGKKIFTEINPWRTVGEGDSKKEVLSIEIPIATDPARTQEYRLRAVVVHSGESREGGHYYTFVPAVVDGKEVWLKFDDLKEDVSVHDLKEPDVVDDIKKNGYSFFYERVVPQ